MIFLRFFSTARREEKVRVLRMEGPVRASAAERASGWRIWLERVVLKVVVGFVEIVHALASLGERVRVGKAFGGIEEGFVSEASSGPKPASSRALRPRVVRIEARWLKE